jgi:hypothetical protein
MARSVFFTPIRRNHVIAPFGVGSVLLARNGISVVMCGLDEWLRQRPNTSVNWLDEGRVVDAYLESSLHVNRLIEPPRLDDDPTLLNTWFIPVARFPTFEYCLNQKCRRVVQRDADEVAPGRCSLCSTQRKAKASSWATQQIPLLLACSNGHLSEIPWNAWVHDPRAQDGYVPDLDAPEVAPLPCDEPMLTYKVSGDVTQPVVRCETCGASARIGPGKRPPGSCPGERPWLPGSPQQACTQKPIVLERTATNLYYSDVRSALYIPSGPAVNHRVATFLEQSVARALIAERGVKGQALDARDLDELVRNARRLGVETTDEEIERHLVARAAPVADPAVERAREIEALLSGTVQTTASEGFPSLIAQPRAITEYRGPLFAGPEAKVSQVCEVSRLAETRVLAGFTRINPGRLIPEVGFEMMWGSRPDAEHNRDWLPAHRVYGEGLLVVLDPDAVDAWESATLHSHARYRDGDVIGGRDVGPRDLLAHTLSHVLMREAAAVCGYALPSLRERLYVDRDRQGRSRTGVLIYTADGDIYGTLGGLVELAAPGKLELLLDRALSTAQWCGADPVCLNPPEDAGLQISPGCCHHCLLVPETTCELFNQWLDRAALIGRPESPGFFG